jgi:hypothetical protein|tara:strand:+ start:179 stop:526 length:348 start_codon:yes stop_codon:yes gene_type:complete
MNYEIVELAGKNYPIFFGFNGLRKYCGMTGTSLNKLMTLGQDMTLDQALKLVLIGIEEGCRKSGQEMQLTIDELGDMLDNDMGGLTRALEIFGKQMGHNMGNAKKLTKKKVENKK